MERRSFHREEIWKLFVVEEKTCHEIQSNGDVRGRVCFDEFLHRPLFRDKRNSRYAPVCIYSSLIIIRIVKTLVYVKFLMASHCFRSCQFHTWCNVPRLDEHASDGLTDRRLALVLIVKDL
jgi:hypothetical protein